MEIERLSIIGQSVLSERKKRDISMGELSKRSGVSKSMLSQIENNKTNPTIITLWKIAKALSINLSKLINIETNKKIEVLSDKDSEIFYSNDKNILFRIINPIHLKDTLEIYHITAKPHGLNKSKPHYTNMEEFLTVISGQFKVKVKREERILNIGDTARYRADQEHVFENITDEIATAFLIVWQNRY